MYIDGRDEVQLLRPSYCLCCHACGRVRRSDRRTAARADDGTPQLPDPAAIVAAATERCRQPPIRPETP